MSKLKKQNNTAYKKTEEPIGARIAKVVSEEKKYPKEFLDMFLTI